MSQSSHKRHDDFSLAMHKLIVKHLDKHPEDLKKASENLRRWSRTTSKHSAPYLAKWKRLISRGKKVVSKVLIDDSEEAINLRHCSPFVGILPNSVVRSVRSRFRR
jgi:hypothetical protein